jgi:hypothetical protein
MGQGMGFGKSGMGLGEVAMGQGRMRMPWRVENGRRVTGNEKGENLE